MWVLFMISIKTVDSFQDKTKFISNLQNLSRIKDKVTRKERGMMKITLICVLGGQFLDSKAKTRGIALNI